MFHVKHLGPFKTFGNILITEDDAVPFRYFLEVES